MIKVHFYSDISDYTNNIILKFNDTTYSFPLCKSEGLQGIMTLEVPKEMRDFLQRTIEEEYASLKIVTQCVAPPIPLRNFDWVAFYYGEDEEGERGWGKTEEEAIQNLKDQANE